MTIGRRLADVFDRGLCDGVESLSVGDRELFFIQDFIIDYKMGGLGPYLYNRLPVTDKIYAAVNAMSVRGLVELSALLQEAASLFDGYVDPNPPSTWDDVCRRYDPTGSLDEIHRRIGQLNNYGLAALKIRDVEPR